MATVAAMRETLSRRGIAPATLSRAEAAAYVGLSLNAFLAEVAAGNLPKPLPLKCRRKLFSRADLDRVLGKSDPAANVEQEIAAAIDGYEV